MVRQCLVHARTGGRALERRRGEQQRECGSHKTNKTLETTQLSFILIVFSVPIPSLASELERQREHAKAVAKAAQRAAERAQSSTVCSSARVVSLVGETTRARPTFDVDAAAPWPARGRLLARWLASVDKFVVRRRVDARLAAMAAHAADRARRKDALAHQRDQGQGAEGGVLAPRQHPLVPSSLENDEEFVRRDFQLCTNNVQR